MKLDREIQKRLADVESRLNLLDSEIERCSSKLESHLKDISRKFDILIEILNKFEFKNINIDIPNINTYYNDEYEIDNKKQNRDKMKRRDKKKDNSYIPDIDTNDMEINSKSEGKEVGVNLDLDDNPFDER